MLLSLITEQVHAIMVRISINKIFLFLYNYVENVIHKEQKVASI